MALIHDVRLDEQADYQPIHQATWYENLDGLGWLTVRRSGEELKIERGPVWASYPVIRRMIPIGSLREGQSARYRANFRLSGYSIGWIYDEWTVNIAHAPWREDLFRDRVYDLERDDRVSLYGKPAAPGFSRT